MIQLIRGECLAEMAKLPDKCVDMVMCDLPYGTTQNKWDSVIDLPRLWGEYRRLCKPDAAVVLTASQPFTTRLVMSALPLFKQDLVWYKNVASNFLNANRQHLVRHESILVFGFGSLLYNPQKLPGKPYKMKRKGTDDSGDCYGSVPIRTDTVNDGSRSPITVLEVAREVGLHPTQKPVQLMEYLIKTYTNESMTVLDNCMGSGTTGVACVNTSRNFIGIEQDERYFEIARDRIEAAETERLFEIANLGDSI